MFSGSLSEESGTLFKEKTHAPVFFSEFCEISKNNFFTEHLRTTASVVFCFYILYVLFISVRLGLAHYVLL